MYPLYRFRPVHKKKQGVPDSDIPSNDDPANKRKEKQPTTEEDERRCDAVAQLLLEGNLLPPCYLMYLLTPPSPLADNST